MHRGRRRVGRSPTACTPTRRRSAGRRSTTSSVGPVTAPRWAAGSAPPLAGAEFLRVWDTRPLADLVDKIEHTMPATSPGTLSRAQATDLVAHMLSASALSRGPGGARAATRCCNRSRWSGTGRRSRGHAAARRGTGARDRRRTAWQHGAVDARDSLSQLESALQRADL